MAPAFAALIPEASYQRFVALSDYSQLRTTVATDYRQLPLSDNYGGTAALPNPVGEELLLDGMRVGDDYELWQ